MIIKLNNEDYISIEEVEDMVGQSASTINVKIRFGHFPRPTKLPVVRFWRRSDIEAYIESTRK